MITFLYGTAYFGDIRRTGAFYVDKTVFLPMLEHPNYGGKNLFFIRPRRFGKSSLLSMMEHYYDIYLADQYDELFRGLWVYDHPTPEKSKYLVLFLNFSAMTACSDERVLQENFLHVLMGACSALAGRYAGRHAALDKFYRDDMRNYTDPAAFMQDLLHLIAGTKDKLYIMIDEYDTFANALLSNDNKPLYEKITDKMGFVRSFYRTLKAGSDAGVVARVFITGGTPILLDDLMTGFNITKNITIRSRFNALAGFTRSDVERAVDELLHDMPELIEKVGDRDTLLGVLERHYNGYRFADDAPERMYNSTLVLYLLNELAGQGKYPKTMLDLNARTDYQKLHSLWAGAGPEAEERRAVLQQMLHEGQVRSPLVERFGVRTTSTSAQFVSLMYYTGLLTLAPEPADGDMYLFETPNLVIRELAWEHYTRLLEDLDGVQLIGRAMSLAVLDMTKFGKIEPFLEQLRKHVLPVLSVRDLRKHDEKAMKMLLIGAIVTAGLFHVLSEKEFSQGFNDLFLAPGRNVPSAKFAWMIELKYVATGASDAEKNAAYGQAEKQLRRYAADPYLVPLLTKDLGLKAGTMLFVGGKDVEWRDVEISTS